MGYIWLPNSMKPTRIAVIHLPVRNNVGVLTDVFPQQPALSGWVYQAATMTLDEQAAALNVTDALLFRRISSYHWAHLGGLGKGHAWAGIINAHTDDDPLGNQVPVTPNTVTVLDFPEATRIIGPYYARATALVRLTHDLVVVLGSLTGPLIGDDQAFLSLAHRVNTDISDVLPAKRLADELEVLHATREVLSTPVNKGLAHALGHLADIARRSLSVDTAVIRHDMTHVHFSSEALDLTDEQWDTVLAELERRYIAEKGTAPGMWVAQDRTHIGSPLISELLPEAVAILTMRIDTGTGDMLVAIHTQARPRGFSDQCVELAGTLVRTGLMVARSAGMRDELRVHAEQAAADARTDRLTGLGNRLAWDEGLADAQHKVDRGASYSVITIDVDGLKTINDTHGHAAGDQLLRECAGIIREHCSDYDLAVRMGGDEFAVLVPHTITSDNSVFTDFRDQLSNPCSQVDQVAASVGLSICPPYGSLSDTVREADMAMYRTKQERRRALRG